MDKIFILAQRLHEKQLVPADLLRAKQNYNRNQLFLIAYAYYLISLTNKNTQKQYKATIDHFTRFLSNTRNCNPLDATGLDVSLWRDDLTRTGGVAGAPPGASTHRYVPQEKASLHTKVAALSAFYRFLQKPGLDGSAPLILHNPVDALHTRTKVEKYGRSKKISRDVLKSILAAIDLSEVKGLRDYALIYGYFITGRRNSEWLSMTWKQLNFNTSPPTYSFIRKGEKDTTDELPETLLNVLISYLIKRWGEDFYRKMQADTYLFTAMPGKGGVRQIVDPNHPITQRSMLRILKVYAKKAGINPRQITVHSLRHLHAESYLEAGASVEEVRARLCHESLATTQRYVSSMKNEKNRLASKLDGMLNLGLDKGGGSQPLEPKEDTP